jgi:hypothetical protein
MVTMTEEEESKRATPAVVPMLLFSVMIHPYYVLIKAIALDLSGSLRYYYWFETGGGRKKLEITV